jgi:fucose 4-O-acetylase-like acetyltransferase
MKRRLEWVDIAKGITILLVVFGHALQGIIDSSHISFYSSNSSIAFTKSIIYGFHMPLFFFMSALFTGFLHRNHNSVILQKAKRLLVPYFIWSLITALFMQIASRYTNSGLGVKNFILSPIVPFSEYWFLYVLFFIYMLYLLVRSIFGQRTKKIVLFIAVFLLVFNSFLPNFWILNKLAQNLFFFALGTYFFGVLNSSNLKINLKIIGITAWM